MTETWPPFIAQSADGSPTGPLWTITQNVAQRAGIQVSVAFVPWKRALEQVSRKRKDGLIGAFSSSERSRRMRFSSVPLFFSETVVFSRKQDPVVVESLASLAGKHVAVSAGYSYGLEVESAADFKRTEIRDIGAGLQLVTFGRVDAFLANRAVGWYAARKLGIADQLVASEKTVSGGPVYLAFSLAVPPELVAAFDRELRAYRETEDYRRIVQDFNTPPGLAAP
ncbi:substrate-binding periplasmic protein [Marinobacter fonticola]|uniref:substrate-binding periplasmic protein n=1 Tax=Marinobacter fonticola TaxID=2603215 RepID=UPI00143DE22B|nr:transporter substrate-binding domain-containing protein [Marinobacter fonticola]